MNMNEFKSQLKDLSSELGGIMPHDVIDRILDSMGLQVRRSAARSVISGTGLFLAGVIIGGAAALLLSPKNGLEIRSDIEDKLDGVIDKLKHMAKRSEAEESAGASTRTNAGSDKGTSSTIHHS